MVNVSKQQLDQALTNQLYIQLSELIARANKRTSKSVVAGLLSDSEHTVLAKRLAILLMLHEGYPQRTIARVLKVSRTTVRRTLGEYERGNYKGVLSVVVSRKGTAEQKQVIETIEVILRLGLPSMGKDRWKWLDKHFPKGYSRKN